MREINLPFYLFILFSKVWVFRNTVQFFVKLNTNGGSLEFSTSMISSSDNCLMFIRARIELPCAPYEYVLPSLRAERFYSPRTEGARSKVTFKLSCASGIESSSEA